MGEMHRANARELAERNRERFTATVVIAAAIIAAVRLAHDEHPARPSPRLMCVLSDSISIARSILERVLKTGV